MHYGVPGMKWGIRRYQNSDGTLTAEGKKKYGRATSINSKYRTKLETKYRDMGMTASQARYQADRNIKIKKILAVTAGVTIAAAAAYAGTKIAKEYCDRTIKSGKIFKRVSKMAVQDTSHNFYATDKMMDALKYKGMYGGGQLGGANGLNKIYQHEIRVNKNMKIASPNSARQIYKELINSGKIERPSGYNINKKRDLKKAYDKFNQNLVTRDKDTNTFYQALRDKGYDAIHDMNDMKYSGYRAKNPMIFFNASDKVSVQKTNKLSQEQLQKDLKKAYGVLTVESLTKDPSVIGTGALVVGKKVSTASKKSQVASLKASGKSNKEIAESLNLSEKTVSKYLKKKN